MQTLKCDVPEGCRGPWQIERFTISEEAAESYNLRLLWQHEGHRRVRPGAYTRLVQRGAFDPMMSDTPSEIRGCWPVFDALEKFGGRVLLNGLGLGMVVKAALLLRSVEQVDVVEIDPDVIALVGPHYTTDPRVVIHEGDALNFQWPRGTRWNVAWHDIWPTICGDNTATMGTLNRRYARRTVWQGAWEQTECQRQNRTNQRVLPAWLFGS